MEKACKDKCHGPGYKSPMDAMKNGPREKIMYVTCLKRNTVDGEEKGDFLSTIDIDPESPTYCQEIHRLIFPNVGDEIHHMGWNACSSCYDDPSKCRRFLVAPCFYSDRIYIIDTADPKAPKLHKTIEPEEVRSTGLGSLHNVHCLPDGHVMISSLGDNHGNAKGGYLLLNSDDFTVAGRWEKDLITTPFGDDFWYQPRRNVMISSELGTPHKLFKGLSFEDFMQGYYGSHINIWNWETHEVQQRINLGPTSCLSLEVRFPHDPNEEHAYVGVCQASGMYHLHKNTTGQWVADKIIDIPVKKVEGWVAPEIPAFITDEVISLDDRFMYLSNYTHGDIRQYDITDRFNFKLVGQVFVGGLICSDSAVKVVEDKELKNQPNPLYLKGKRVEGGPHRLQLSLDGKRLYVTFALLSVWDKQFFPNVMKNGGHLIQIDVDTEKGGLSVNKDFSVHFTNDPYGPSTPHEMRYPGGDCTSDIWL